MGREAEARGLGLPTADATTIDALDGVRGVAVLLVIVVHACHELRTQTTNSYVHSVLDHTSALWGLGGTGVHLFFVLSGFLLFQPYARCLCGLQSFPSTRRFLTRRCLRILPAYWVSLAVLVVLGLATYRAPRGQDLLLHMVLLHNWTDATRLSINGPYWTMAVEAQFYLLLPALAAALVALHRRGRPKLLLAFAAVVASASPLEHLGVLGLSRFAPWVRPHLAMLETVSFLSVFAAGMLASLLYVVITEGVARWSARSVRRVSRATGIAGAAGLAGLTTARVLGLPLGMFDYYLFSPFVGACYASVLVATLLGVRQWERALSARWLRFVGIVSYSLYLWHYPILQRVVVPAATRLHSALASSVALLVLSVAVLVPVASVSYALVESPFLRTRRSQQ
jgi:peptidoglycan/LPS O-acetylase OafA/YrhL